MKIKLDGDAYAIPYITDEHRVSFSLTDNEDLNKIADLLRVSKGYPPFFNVYEGKEIWDDGWYEFSLKVDPTNMEILDLIFEVVGNCHFSNDVPDDGKEYSLGHVIDRNDLMKQLLKELKKYDMTLEDVAKEAEDYV